MSSKIFSVTGREILDSRGNPTVEVMVILESGWRGVASVPSGASVGSFEAQEIRDADPSRYEGMGVLKAVSNVNTTINNSLRGMDALDQSVIDKTLIDLDGTPNKSNLGVNAILGVSHAVSVAASCFAQKPLYQYLNELFSKRLPTPIEKIPTPMFNIINGGKHGAGNLNFQEFLVIPATNRVFHEALEMGASIYSATRKMLQFRNAIHSIGDEGGFAPNLFKNMDAFEILIEAIKSTKFRFGVDVYLGLDVAANNFRGKQGYQIKDRPSAFTREEFIAYLMDLHATYHLLVLEDALEDTDWEGWVQLTEKIGRDVLIVGDDFLATNMERLERAIKEKACSGILAKPNQIGTLSEYLDVTATAKKNNIRVIASHRSGETNDSFIADLAVAIQSDYVKFGAPARGERVVKYNRLLAIESEIRKSQ
jgi:enolase